MKLPRRKFLHLVAGVAALPLAPRIARAQAYPTRPVRIIVGVTPGSAADVSARIIAQKLGSILGGQWVVENRPGAGTSIATQLVTQAAKDGYTLLLMGSVATVNATLLPNLKFDVARDLAPICLINTIPNILVAHPSLSVSSIDELIALARSKPGEIFYASS